MLPDWLIQIPLVAAFIWFALQLNKSHQNAMDKLIIDNRAANMSVMADWRENLRQRDLQWQNFLIEQRNSTNEALDSVAERMSEISRVVADLDRHTREEK